MSRPCAAMQRRRLAVHFQRLQCPVWRFPFVDLDTRDLQKRMFAGGGKKNPEHVLSLYVSLQSSKAIKAFED